MALSMTLSGAQCCCDGKLHAEHDRATFTPSDMSFSGIVTAFENGDVILTRMRAISSLSPTKLRPAMKSFTNEDDTIDFPANAKGFSVGLKSVGLKRAKPSSTCI
jgi:hypothetical protein